MFFCGAGLFSGQSAAFWRPSPAACWRALPFCPLSLIGLTLGIFDLVLDLRANPRDFLRLGKCRGSLLLRVKPLAPAGTRRRPTSTTLRSARTPLVSKPMHLPTCRSTFGPVSPGLSPGLHQATHATKTLRRELRWIHPPPRHSQPVSGVIMAARCTLDITFQLGHPTVRRMTLHGSHNGLSCSRK